MNGKILALLFTVLMTGTAGAAQEIAGDNNFNSMGERVFAPAYGPTLPPMGYVDFCARNPSECTNLGGHAAVIELTPERFDLLKQVNTYVNTTIKPESDLQQYHKPEYWTYPVTAGDCEDYALLKQRYLEGFGFPSETLLMTVVLDEAGEGHAVLMAHTSAGDYILDNRRNQILRWSDTHYQYLKRQSQSDPKRWLALTNSSIRGKGTIAGGN